MTKRDIFFCSLIIGLGLLGWLTVGTTAPSGPRAPTASERLDEWREAVKDDAAKMGMTPDEYLATGKAINDAIKRYGR
jgi:hypothetical protein